MEKFIKVYDNILSKELEDRIESLVLDPSLGPRFPLYYHPNSVQNPKDSTYYFNPGLFHVFKGNKGSSKSDYGDFLSQVLYNFCSKVNIILYNYFKGRLYIDLPSPNPGLDLPPHVDMAGINHWVLLYYLNDSDGDTVLFKDDMKTEIKRVSPKKGRIVFFDGSIFHCGSRPSSNTRGALNFNFIGEKL